MRERTHAFSGALVCLPPKHAQHPRKAQPFMASVEQPVLRITIASTRPGRVGLSIGQWFRDKAVAHGALDIQVTDLLELNLPFMDEPNHPRLQQYTKQHTKDWS